MARIHRPPPPIPTAEHDDSEENYGVWAENEFDDGEVYENYENGEGDKEDNSDYEEPDDTTNTPTAQKAACPGQPPVPPRQGARQTPFPTPLLVPVPAAGGRVSPRVSPIPTDRRKFVPQPPVAVKDEDDEMYEAVDSPLSPVDDGEVYSEVDNEPLPQKPTAITEKRALPPFPKAGVVRPPVPNPPNVLQLPNTKSSKSSLSPKLGRREVPAPPLVVKSTPPNNRLFPLAAKAMSQPTLPPPSPELIRNEEEEAEEEEEMYEQGDFYMENESTQAFAAAKPSKPLPKPPQDEEQDDEYYTEVPELSRPAGSYSKADRPIPPIPQPQSSSLRSSASSQSFTGSTRIPVEKLQAGLARLAEAKAIATAGDQNTAKSAEDSSVGSFSGSALANAKKLLKPVSRGESLNSSERPVTISVKRAESDNFKAGFEKKGSLLSEMKNKLDSKQTDFGKVNARTPATHYEDAEPVKKSPTPNRKPVLQSVAADSKSPPLSVLENYSKRPLVQTNVASDRLLPPKIPPSRNSGQITTSSTDISINLDSSDCQRKVALSAQSGKDKPLPQQVPSSAERQGSLCSFGWFFDTIERQNAERKLLEINQDGAFLVRKSQRGGDFNPYTLTLLYSGHVYNLHTRKRKDGKFALGTEKPDEHVFNSVEDLINFHRNNPIEVVGDARKNMGPGKVILKSSPKK